VAAELPTGRSALEIQAHDTTVAPDRRLGGMMSSRIAELRTRLEQLEWEMEDELATTRELVLYRIENGRVGSSTMSKCCTGR
jgi:hypothetical protein